MESLVDELRQQYQFTLGMYQSVLEACTDEIWHKDFSGVPFWREAYHVVFWMYLYGGPKDTGFHPHPFGKDIRPELLRLSALSRRRTWLCSTCSNSVAGRAWLDWS